MWPITAHQLADILDAHLLGNPQASGLRLLTDSRAKVNHGDVFLGLVGPNHDGGKFAARALRDGAAIVIAGPAHMPPTLADDQAWIRVEDPLAALHALAIAAREAFKGTVVAITGSMGKTTVKEMLVAALADSRRVFPSPQSYNSQVGVALSLVKLEAQADVAVIECGISEVGEMERLERIVRPDCGIFVHVGPEHLEGLGDLEACAREKAGLFRRVSAPNWVLVPESEELARAALREQGINAIDIVDGVDPDEATDGLPESELFQQPHLRRAAALALEAAKRLGAKPELMHTGLTGWRPAPMRLEMSITPRRVMLINDAYSGDPTSVEVALEALAKERADGDNIAVLAGLTQLGMAGSDAHERIGGMVVAHGVDRLIGVGAGGAEIAQAAIDAGMDAQRVHKVEDVTEAAMVLDEHTRPGDRVLLKGSRPEALERIAPIFFESVSPARVYVDLDAVVSNVQRVQQAVGPDCGVMAVVKSFGYGLDAVRVSRVLERAGIAHLAVAYPDEGALLRDRGIGLPILVLNTVPMEADKLVHHDLSAAIGSLEQATWLAAEARRQRHVLRVHLKVETGLGRAGTFLEDVADLARTIVQHDWLQLEGLMTHFSVAEEPDQDDFTRQQIHCFDTARKIVEDLGGRPRWVHACNSAGIARFPEAHYNLVRAGLAVAGYSRVPERVAMGQRPALRLVTQIVHVKDLPPGHDVGYGRAWNTGEQPRRIAVVALGYNDGYLRSLSNKGWMLVHDQRCNVVGRVCMDVVMIDVTELGDRVKPGDDVVVFGPGDDEPCLLELAELAGTIPNELLTGISLRVRRIFHTQR